jgi:hypothetical protein
MGASICGLPLIAQGRQQCSNAGGGWLSPKCRTATQADAILKSD